MFLLISENMYSEYGFYIKTVDEINEYIHGEKISEEDLVEGEIIELRMIWEDMDFDSKWAVDFKWAVINTENMKLNSEGKFYRK